MERIIKVGKRKYVLKEKFFNICFKTIIVSFAIIALYCFQSENASYIEVDNSAIAIGLDDLELEESLEVEISLLDSIIEEVHPEIQDLSYEILRVANSDYWQEAYHLYEHLNSDYIAALLVSIAQIESGQGYHPEEQPSQNATGNGWGLFQIEYLGKDTRTSLVKESDGINVQIGTSRDSFDERLDPLISIEWASAHLYNLVVFFDGDIEKSIQSYNYGAFALKWLVDDYQDEWVNNLDKVVSVINSRSSRQKTSHGDSQYLSKILALMDS